MSYISFNWKPKIVQVLIRISYKGCILILQAEAEAHTVNGGQLTFIYFQIFVFIGKFVYDLIENAMKLSNWSPSQHKKLYTWLSESKGLAPPLPMSIRLNYIRL